MFGKTTKRGERRWRTVLGLSFVVALVLALLVLWLYRPSRPVLPERSERSESESEKSADLPSNLAQGPSARQAYEPAVEVAQSWQSDARPAIASAHWRPRRGQWPSEVTWMFQFYSSSTHRLAVIVVEGGRAQILRDAVSPYALATFEEVDWQVDSPAALRIWWNAGGAAFQSTYSEVDLIAQLRILEKEEGKPLVWTVTGIAGEQMMRVLVDGATGEPFEGAD